MPRSRLLILGVLVAIVGWKPLHAQSAWDEVKRFSYIFGVGSSTPVGRLGNYFGVNGSALAGIGARISRRNSIQGEFQWSAFSGEPNIPNRTLNYSILSANYRYHVDSISGSAFGIYVIGGGGWYQRHISNYTGQPLPPFTSCQTIYTWIGYSCDGAYASTTVDNHRTNTGGINGGVGVTLRVRDSSWAVFAESRFHYAWTPLIRTTYIPLTLGVRFK